MAAAIYHAAAGEADEMFQALEGAYERHDWMLVEIWLPIFDRYHADLRFQALLRRMNLA